MIEKLPKFGLAITNITGYENKVGTKVYNLAMSEKRAQTIRNYLVNKGFTAESIKAEVDEWKNYSDSCNSKE
jgi:OmpA-OmpF porin, OOP family